MLWNLCIEDLSSVPRVVPGLKEGVCVLIHRVDLSKKRIQNFMFVLSTSDHPFPELESHPLGVCRPEPRLALFDEYGMTWLHGVPF